MPFDFQKYDAKCAAMSPAELQLQWEHYTRLISGAATSTAVSGVALPLTMGVSVVGVALAAPAIHNARKKREIIEKHLNSHGTSHVTRKRDVLSSVAISGTIGVVTMGASSLAADAVTSHAANYGIQQVVENELAVKVGTHVAFDAAAMAGEHAHTEHKRKKEALKAGLQGQMASTQQINTGQQAPPDGFYPVIPIPQGHSKVQTSEQVAAPNDPNPPSYPYPSSAISQDTLPPPPPPQYPGPLLETPFAPSSSEKKDIALGLVPTPFLGSDSKYKLVDVERDQRSYSTPQSIANQYQSYAPPLPPTHHFRGSHPQHPTFPPNSFPPPPPPSAPPNYPITPIQTPGASYPQYVPAQYAPPTGYPTGYPTPAPTPYAGYVNSMVPRQYIPEKQGVSQYQEVPIPAPQILSQQGQYLEQQAAAQQQYQHQSQYFGYPSQPNMYRY
ncbi:hypothetical protein TWF481_006463 [Arthrobotrys musiformis]|uniref:Uncharacterized protein n=1 Tax=Arthrobotrys musiformis TaxID=47236 RepID=A0AAV9WMH0_9PEZI